MKHIVLVGCGKMGTAMLKGWIDHFDSDTVFTIIDPFMAVKNPFIDNKRITVLAQASPAKPPHPDIIAPDIIVLAVKPQVMEQALAPLVNLAGADTLWLSIAAGISIDWLRQRITPDAAIIRTMPNTPAAIGKGVTAMAVGDGVSEAMQKLAEEILSVVGKVVRLDDEADMDAVTAVSGSGPAYVFLMRESLEAAARTAGLEPGLAAMLAEETISGAVALMRASDLDARQLRIDVTSPGGTTEAALKILMADKAGLPALMEKAVLAAQKRALNLGS